MTATEVANIAVRYTRLGTRNIYVFILLAVMFGGWTVISPDVNETEVYADVRKVMAIIYTLLSVSLLLISLHFTARGNAAFRLAAELLPSEAAALVPGVFRPVSALWILFPMTATIIIINYVVLIYAVDGGLF